MRTCSCARANDAKIVRSRDAQCNTKELPSVKTKTKILFQVCKPRFRDSPCFQSYAVNYIGKIAWWLFGCLTLCLPRRSVAYRVPLETNHSSFLHSNCLHDIKTSTRASVFILVPREGRRAHSNRGVRRRRGKVSIA